MFTRLHDLALAAALLAPFLAGPALAAGLDSVDAHTIDARGWAAGTQGGEGGRILRVTTLAASGPGSLRAAIEAEGPRIVVFEVGGVIDMAGGELVIKNPFITIAGQTAPSPGITVIKAETRVQAAQVIVQHLRFRPGEFGRPKKGGGDQDGLSTVGAVSHVIVDHCSFSWGTDENLSASGPRFTGEAPEQWRAGTSHQITYSHNLLYESLGHSVHEKGEHSKGTLVHDNTRGILLYRNVYASNRERNALFKGGAQGAMVNNLIFNPGRYAVHYNLWRHEWGSRPAQTGHIALVGNVYRMGPDTAVGTALFTLRGDADVELFLGDNLALDAQRQPVAATAVRVNAGSVAQIRPLASAGLPADVLAMPAARLEASLLDAVGARPWDRDALDARVLQDTRAGRGKLIDSELESPLGGYLRPAPTRRAFVEADWNLKDMSPRAGWGAIGRLTQPTPATP